jgi:alpha-D-ribose 1-methylphosphonate 5-triphosphate diphosphatase
LIAIKNGRIVVPDRILEDKVLLIENDRIKALADEANGADWIIDAHGRYLTRFSSIYTRTG